MRKTDGKMGGRRPTFAHGPVLWLLRWWFLVWFHTENMPQSRFALFLLLLVQLFEQPFSEIKSWPRRQRSFALRDGVAEPPGNARQCNRRHQLSVCRVMAAPDDPVASVRFPRRPALPVWIAFALRPDFGALRYGGNQLHVPEP